MSAQTNESKTYTPPVTKVGNLARDFELKTLDGGKVVANSAIAVEQWNPATKQADPVQFYDVTVWDSMAANASQSLFKGMRVVVHGVPSVRSWTDSDTNQEHTAKQISVIAIGPDLRWATATVTPIRSNAGKGQSAKALEVENF